MSDFELRVVPPQPKIDNEALAPAIAPMAYQQKWQERIGELPREAESKWPHAGLPRRPLRPKVPSRLARKSVSIFAERHEPSGAAVRVTEGDEFAAR